MSHTGFGGIARRFSTAIRRAVVVSGGKTLGRVAAVVTVAAAALAQAPVCTGAESARERALGPATAHLRVPLRFEPNLGQTDSEVRFLARALGYTLWLTPQEVVMGLRAGGDAAAGAPDVIRLRWVGARPDPEVTGIERAGGESHYLTGDDPSSWVTGVPHFARVRYAGVFPGIDVELYGNDRQVEYDFVVAPGRDPRRIEVEVVGARSMRVRSDGALELQLAHGTLVQHRPLVYQVTAAGRREVRGKYDRRGRNRFGFTVGRYDRGLPLVIDPVLSYSTYLGGSDADLAMGVALAPRGAG